MLVKFIMKIFEKFFKNNEKLNANEIAICTDSTNGKYKHLDEYLNKNILTAYFTNFKSTGSLSPVTGLNIGEQIGSNLILLDNGIKIGSGISKVLISGWGFNNSNSSGAGFIAGITKNGVQVSEPLNTSNWQMANCNNDNITMIIPPMLLNVSEGDVVNIGLGINGNTTNSFSRGAVTVEVIK